MKFGFMVMFALFTVTAAHAGMKACVVNGGPVSSTPCLAGETRCHSQGFGDNSCQGALGSAPRPVAKVAPSVKK